MPAEAPDDRRDTVECYVCGGNGAEQVGYPSTDYDGEVETRECHACHGIGRLDLDAVRNLVDDEDRDHHDTKQALLRVIEERDALLRQANEAAAMSSQVLERMKVIAFRNDEIIAEIRRLEPIVETIRADREAFARQRDEYRREWESACERATTTEHLRQEAEKRSTVLTEALRDLVAVKDLKERWEQLHPKGTHATKREQLRTEYLERQPKAWAAARAALREPR